MLYRIRLFFQLSAPDQRLFVYCWLLLGWKNCVLNIRPFSHVTKNLKQSRGVAEPAVVTAAQLARAKALSKMVARAARYTPWQSLCLVQVLANQVLLAREGIAGQFYLGASTGARVNQPDKALAAHAWLECGDEIISGIIGHKQYAVLARFSWSCG